MKDKKEKELKIRTLILSKVCVSVAEAKRVIDSGGFDKVMRKYYDKIKDKEEKD